MEGAKYNFSFCLSEKEYELLGIWRERERERERERVEFENIKAQREKRLLHAAIFDETI